MKRALWLAMWAGLCVTTGCMAGRGPIQAAKCEGPFCQSCAMPLEKPEMFGTDKEGVRINDYCRFCYRGGEFSEPKITADQMAEKCTRIMVDRGIMPEKEAREILARTLPKLKRWQRP
jgi:hypothetical protein